MEHLYKQCKEAFWFKMEETYNIKAQMPGRFYIITFESLSDYIFKAFLKRCTLKMTGSKVAGGAASTQRGPLESRVCVTANALPA